MALSAISPLPLAVSFGLGFHRYRPLCSISVGLGRHFSYPRASLSSSSSESKSAKASSPGDNGVSSNGTSGPFVEPSRATDSNFNYAFANPTGGDGGGGARHPFSGFMQSTESTIERVFFFSLTFRFQLGFSILLVCPLCLVSPVEDQKLCWLLIYPSTLPN